jgi:hypothetical protein
MRVCGVVPPEASVPELNSEETAWEPGCSTRNPLRHRPKPAAGDCAGTKVMMKTDNATTASRRDIVYPTATATGNSHISNRVGSC